MCPPGGSTTQDKILLRLKKSGPATASGIAEELSVTSSAIRQHLCELESAGLIDYEEVRAGTVGRPQKQWHVVATSAANACFPDMHANLTVALIAAARSAFGDEGIERLIVERVRVQTEDYLAHIEEDASLADRVGKLSALRSGDGYMSGWVEETAGTFLLWENHCPVCAAATTCQSLCAGELDMFRGVFGEGVSVERVEYLMNGDRRCAYRIESSPVTFVSNPVTENG
jgi:predicted ArsR family transcriptional regulator